MPKQLIRHCSMHIQNPFRELVNHDWMASPYLPAAQLLFLSVTGIVFRLHIFIPNYSRNSGFIDRLGRF